MGDKKSSKAIRVQWFIPVVPCGSQLIYSIRSLAFEAKRSPEVPNLSFRLLVFKHGALCSSAPPHLPLYSAFCATPQPFCSQEHSAAHSKVPVHQHSSSHHLMSLLLSLSVLAQLFTKGFSSTIKSPNTTAVDALQPLGPLCLLQFLNPAQCHWLVSLQTSKYKSGFLILLSIWP